MRILMVCLGNICRSPLAEGIMKEKIKEKGIDWHIDSAGTGPWHVGERPDSRSMETAQEHGINISDQRARQLSKSDLKDFDLILTMDSSNYQNVVRMASTEKEKEKIELIMNFAKPGYNQNIPDPYYDDNGFENAFQMLDLACDQIINRFSN